MFKKNKSKRKTAFEASLDEDDGFVVSTDPECIPDVLTNCRSGNPVSVVSEPSDVGQDLSRIMRFPASIIDIEEGSCVGLMDDAEKEVEPSFLQLTIESICITGLCPTPEDSARIYFSTLQNLEEARAILENAIEKRLCVILTPTIIWPSLNGVHLEDCEAEVTNVPIEEYLSHFEKPVNGQMV